MWSYSTGAGSVSLTRSRSGTATFSTSGPTISQPLLMPSERGDVVLVAWDGFGVATRYAATERERVSALVLYEPFLASDDDWESGAQRRGQRNEANQRGENDILAEVAPSRLADRDFREWFARAGRTGASPSTALRIWRSVIGTFPSEAR